jgi:hypothetical protein
VGDCSPFCELTSFVYIFFICCACVFNFLANFDHFFVNFSLKFPIFGKL